MILDDSLGNPTNGSAALNGSVELKRKEEYYDQNWIIDTALEWPLPKEWELLALN